ncbi:MAG TPA: group I intron-associated PD-(D/E)XK endonuclease [Ktedonobacteraceae bacterium]|nr:group I intron-associated PD-(D/E)XK endonuclease [Ktedonobacteraceae bacterium]
MTRKHYRGDVEYFAVYSPDTDKVYLIPIDHVGTAHASLRLIPAKSSNQHGIRMAQDYEL